MRLTDFIRGNLEPILAEWEKFARLIWPSTTAVSPEELRDHAEGILRSAVEDMTSAQTLEEQAEKSKGFSRITDDKSGLDYASELHAVARLRSGFEMRALVAEYRALRACVLNLWRQSRPDPDANDLNDMTRFNESVDQSLSHAIGSFLSLIEADRAEILANEQAARRAAETANRAKDLFLATLSHELRTPLSAIVGWLSLLRSENCDAADFKEGLDVIQRNTDAQLELIADVLDVSRIISGKLFLEIRPCETIEYINAGIDALRPAAAARGITLDVQLDPAASRTMCDGRRLQQIVWNLVSNAVKFTPKGGRITIRLDREPSDIRFEVSDNGKGIGPELLPYVFDRFRQGDSSSKRMFGGLGLGLAIVKHLVEAHGGTVTAESAGAGKGSRFVVCLPVMAVLPGEGSMTTANSSTDTMLDEAEVATTAAPQRPLVRLDDLLVLVVDDEADGRRLLLKVMKQAGAMVTAASSAAEALGILSNFKPRVLISDLGMPDVDGFDLIRQIRERSISARELPAIALTAFAHPDDERQALSAGFQMYISKPVDPHDLTAAIAKVIQNV